MVVFTCNHCGESLQKPKVEKHYSFVCRRVKNLTCVDCFKDFRGEDYAVHIKCCTEEERYAAKGAHPNGIVKKGDVKQESWLNQVRSIIDKETNLTPVLKNLLNTISQYNNIPRKKKKFINFIMNSMGRRVNVNDVEAAWDIIEKHTNNTTTKQSNNDNPSGKVQTNDLDKLEESCIENQLQIPSEKKPKSEKKKRKEKTDSTDIENINNRECETTNEDCKKKKKKKEVKNEKDCSHIEFATNNDSKENIQSDDIKDKPKLKNKNTSLETQNIIVDDPIIENKKQKKIKGCKENGENNAVACNSDLDTYVGQNESLGVTTNTLIDGKKKKRKNNIDMEENDIPIKSAKVSKTEVQSNECENSEENPFNMTEKVISILEKKGSRMLKKLEKAVVSSYMKHCGETDVQSIMRKFHKELRKMPIEIEEDRVYLKQVK